MAAGPVGVVKTLMIPMSRAAIITAPGRRTTVAGSRKGTSHSPMIAQPRRTASREAPAAGAR